MHNLEANIIAWTTVVLTVGGCVWFGIRVAQRNKKYPRKIEYTGDGFVYHGPLGDRQVRWRDITSVEVKKETHRSYRGKYSRGRLTEFPVLDVTAGRDSFNIFADDFEHVSFDEFIALTEKRVRESNSPFQGILGDVRMFREDIPSPDQETMIDAGTEAEEKDHDMRKKRE